jgi:hypothetical protein
MSIFSTSDGLSWTKGYSGSAKEKKRKKKTGTWWHSMLLVVPRQPGAVLYFKRLI